MKWVNPNVVEDNLPEGWLKEASDALHEIEKLEGAERAKAINNKSAIWSKAKDALWKSFYGKCWYCESIDPRSDNAVDHFRPKNRIAEAKDMKEGYWWLAFEWTNYRFSCTFCNSYRKSDGVTGGKQDHFPLLNETKRAKGPKPPDAIDGEEPKLLDPMVSDDQFLLNFELDTGEAVPRCEDEKSEEYIRADESITRYHLNQKVIKKRRKNKMRDIRNKVRNAQKHYDKRACDTSAKKAYREHLAELLTMTESDAEYSSAAAAALRALRGENVIARKLLGGE